MGAWAMRRAAGVRAGLVGLVGLGGGVVAADVAAHEIAAPAVDVDGFKPGLQRDDGLALRSARPLLEGETSVRAGVRYGRGLLRFVNTWQGVKRTQTVVGDLAIAEVGAGLGLARGWSLAFGLPVAIVVRGGGPNLTQQPEAMGPALGDLRVEARRHLLERPAGGGNLDLAAGMGVGLPTADAGSWLGGAWALELEGLLTWQRGPLRLDANLGARLRSTQELATHAVDPATGAAIHAAAGAGTGTGGLTALRTGSQFQFGLGAAHDLGTAWRARAELHLLRAAPGVAAVPEGQLVVDLLAGADVRLHPAWSLQVGLGAAPTTGPGSAGLRAFAAVTLEPGALPADQDADRIDDKADRCPTEAEDLDGFEDHDGCPELDDDQDGVPDAADRCPRTAEDKDGTDDQDGCPEPDDDRDGVPDVIDRCPKEIEDIDGFEDKDGCPEPDNDGDGIKDVDDVCPLSPENRNSFEDNDGCPDIAPLKRDAPGPAAVAPAGSTLAPPAPAPVPAAVPAVARKPPAPSAPPAAAVPVPAVPLPPRATPPPPVPLPTAPTRLQK